MALTPSDADHAGEGGLGLAGRRARRPEGQQPEQDRDGACGGAALHSRSSPVLGAALPLRHHGPILTHLSGGRIRSTTEIHLIVAACPRRRSRRATLDPTGPGGHRGDMHILGISAFYHDSAAALVRDGELVAAAQEERFTRIKHDAAFPANAVRYCLDHAGVARRRRRRRRLLRQAADPLRPAPAHLPRHGAAGVRAPSTGPCRSGCARSSGSPADRDRADGPRLRPARGPLVHRAPREPRRRRPSSRRRSSPPPSSPSTAWASGPPRSIGVGRGNEIELVRQLNFPHSLGLLYSAFTYYCGFRVNSGEYKLMGLAPYGEPRLRRRHPRRPHRPARRRLVPLDLRYFGYLASLRMTNGRFDDLFGGPPRAPESDLTQREMDLARSIQEVTEEIVLRMARTAASLTGERRAVLAGGVALNCVANGRLLREGPFDDLWIQPAAGDAGGAVGAALCGWHQVLRPRAHRHPRPTRMHGALPRPVLDHRRDRGLARRAGLPLPAPGARRAGPGRRRAASPTATSSACSRGAWSSGPGPSATARSSATPARRRCSR